MTKTNIIKMGKLKDARKAAIEKMNEEARALFTELCAEIFAKHKKLQSFSWTQYTPYFCDGDPCEFSVNSDPEIVYDGVEYNYYHYEKEIPDHVKDCIDEVSQLLRDTPDDAMLGMFGDHCSVVVPREGKTTTEDYEHD